MESIGKNKRDDFKDKLKGIAAVGAAGLVTAGVTVGAIKGKQDLQSMDMSNYNLNNQKYMEYLDGTESEADRLVLLEENIRIYKELSANKKLTDMQKEALSNAKSKIKREMTKDLIADLYLDIFKEKMKSSYHVKDVKVEYNVGNNIEKHFSVKFDGNTYMDEKDKSKEIKSAVWDIVSLQYMSEDATFDDKELKEFVKIYENMKGFSNLEFTKQENEPLKVNETCPITLKDGDYELVTMDFETEER